MRLMFTLQLESEKADPYAFFDLRSHFMESFRQLAGCGEPRCGACVREFTCSYHQTFSQPLSADPAALRRYQKPSLPFAFDMPVLSPSAVAGEPVELGLTIAGSAVNNVEQYIAAMEEMLRSPGLRRKVKAHLLKIETVGIDGARSMVKEPGGDLKSGQLLIFSLKGLRQGILLPSDTITLAIATPMRLIAEGRPVREFSFSPFVRALFRRLSSMSYYYGGEEDQSDYKWLAEQSRRVECVAADFRWAAWGDKWSGVVGRGTFRGELTDFHPYLIAGEYLHVGKGASFGLGRFLLDKGA